MKTTLSNLISWGCQELTNATIPNPQREANLILGYILNKNTLILPPDQLISSSQTKKFQNLIKRRQTHEPFAYLTGMVKFHDHQIFVNRNVLIPRPETELLVDIISEYLSRVIPGLPAPKKAGTRNPEKNIPGSQISDPIRFWDDNRLKIADIGTGSAAIAIALAKQFPDLHIIASDKYSKALKVARKNIAFHHLEPQISLLKSDLLTSLPDEPLDIIIANLPYIPTPVEPEIDKTVTDFEPRHALFSGPKGLDLIQKLLTQSVSKTRPGSRIFLEIWPDQRDSLIQIVKTLYAKADISFYKDLSGSYRFASITVN